MAINEGIRLTQSAQRHFEKCLAQDANSDGVRLAVKKSGCSGFSYTLELAHGSGPSDIQMMSETIPLYVDSKSLTQLQGIEIDYVNEGLNGFIKFNNPKAQDICGCGESFNLAS